MFDVIIDNIIIYASDCKEAKRINDKEGYEIFRAELRNQIEMLCNYF